EPRGSATEAKADGDDRRTVEPTQMLYGCGDVLLDEIRLRLLHVRHVLEVVIALFDARGAPEVVDRNGGVATLRKAKGQLLVEPVEATDIRKDHDADGGRLLRNRAERCEPVPIRGGQNEIVVRDRRP